MCGVFGYVGEPTAVVPMVADALRVMEYRGYDSWGIGWDQGSRVEVLKRTGRVPQQLPHAPTAGIAIGHTRWATHGGVTDANAHPHTNHDGQMAVVHNGVIENAEVLRQIYLAHVVFQSQTDSEIVPHLISLHMNKGDSFADAVRSTFLMLEGSSAIVAMDRATEMIAAVTARSPLRLGRRTDGWELASDPLACAHTSQEIAVIPDHHLVVLTRDAAHLVDVHHGTEVALSWEPTPEEVATTRGAFPHFTLKEIHDQVMVAEDLALGTSEVQELANAIKAHRHVLLTGCGSAFYAATLGAGWLAQSTEAWIDVVPASEIGPHTRNLGAETLVIALTQSGETADVVDAIQTARRWGSTIATVINTQSSTVARMADLVVPIHAGVERSVLATKSFMAMALRLHQVAEALASAPTQHSSDFSQELQRLIEVPYLPCIASDIGGQPSMIVLGAGMGRAIAQEAALKIKEGSYLHAEAFLMGELKHGPLALVQRGTPCLVFATCEEEMAAARIAATEVASRGGHVIGIGAFEPGSCATVVNVSDIGPLTPLLHLAIAQLLAYHIAIFRDVDPDFPRNLAKSVTVR